MNRNRRRLRQRHLPPFIAWAIILLPLAWAAISSRLSVGLGHSGLVALSFSILTGIRSRWADKIFGSLNSSYHFHHLASLSALVFFSGHVIVASLPFFSIDLLTAFDFLSDFTDATITTGWIAFVLISFTVAFSFVRRFRKSVWQYIHRLGIVGYSGALVHYGLAHSGISLRLPDWVTLTMLILTVVSVLLYVLWPKALRSTSEFEVSRVTPVSKDVIDVSLKPLQDPLKFAPGQFVYLSFHCTQGCGVSHEWHPFTIASSSSEAEIRMAIKALGDDTSSLMHLRPGTRVTMEGPYGNLLSDIDVALPQLWIAGGMGITPFLSYLRSWQNTNRPLNIALVVLASHPEEHYFKKELEAIGDAHTNFKIHVHTDTEQGTFSVSELKCLVPDWAEREMTLSGPPGFVRTFAGILRKNLAPKSIAGTVIHTEAFDFL